MLMPSYIIENLYISGKVKYKRGEKHGRDRIILRLALLVADQ